MKKVKHALFTAILGLAISITLSCSDDNTGGNTITIPKITGVVQKGSFIAGSKAVLYELNDKLEQTGRSFEDVIADNYGNFEIKSVELNSPYAMLNASGKYRNEVTGEVSVGDINLYAIVDLTDRDKVNINVLTHLEYYRVQKLVENGMSVKDAKKQAQREILAVFGISGDFENSEDMDIFGTTESDAALLAISVMLLGDLSEDKIIERLNDFRQSFKENGIWENSAAKEAIADWASAADLMAIKSNVLSWELSNEVPEFGSYIHNYWVSNYEFGECTANRQGEIKSKVNTDENYICKNESWQVVSYKDMVCFEENNCDYFTDSRDGKIYAYVVIGEQTWMAENLNYNAEGSVCNANNNKNCAKYGRLYNWETAMEVCPTNWHLPSDDDWDKLYHFVDGTNGVTFSESHKSDVAGKHLMAKSGWGGFDSDHLDTYGFAALPGGNFGGFLYDFYDVGYSGSWWSI